MTPDYIRAVVCADPWRLMLLSFIESPITLSSWSNSFTHGRATGHIFDSPFIRFTPLGDGTVEAPLDRYVLRVLEFNLNHNPYYRALASLLEVGFPSYSHPCVDPRFFGPRTLATMHQSDDLASQAVFADVSDSCGQFGVLDTSYVFDYQKDGVFEVSEDAQVCCIHLHAYAYSHALFVGCSAGGHRA